MQRYDFFENAEKIEALSSISKMSTNVHIFSERKEKAKAI
jgi:hypothetical protein